MWTLLFIVRQSNWGFLILKQTLNSTTNIRLDLLLFIFYPKKAIEKNDCSINCLLGENLWNSKMHSRRHILIDHFNEPKSSQLNSGKSSGSKTNFYLQLSYIWFILDKNCIWYSWGWICQTTWHTLCLKPQIFTQNLANDLIW